MKAWPEHPVVYEIHTWVWLGELSRQHERRVDLATVPEQEWDGLAAQGFDAVWLMGVWERSPVGTAISMRNPGLLEDFRKALPDFTPEDNVGSPYCVRSYIVDEHLGGPDGLAAARRALAVGLLVGVGRVIGHGACSSSATGSTLPIGTRSSTAPPLPSTR